MIICKEFKVHRVRQVLEDIKLQTDKVPDHSVLELTFAPHYGTDVAPESEKQPLVNDKEPVDLDSEGISTLRYFTRYNVRAIPDDFFKSEMACDAITKCINDIISVKERQAEIDRLYEDYCNVYYSEMDRWLKKRNLHSKGKNYVRRFCKPFWNETLTLLWQKVCEAETAYLNCAQHTLERRNLKTIFKENQNNFDKIYKKAKRKFQ